MSHQSLEDLVNVSGSPADGKILKYNSGAWGPADESGGGSSGAEYLEIFEHGDAADMGGYLLGSGGTNASIIHNSIPQASVFKRADAPVGITYSSDYQHSSYNDVFWIAYDASAEYLVEIDMLVKYDSSSTQGVLVEWGKSISNTTYSVSDYGRRPNLNTDTTYTFSGTNASLSGITGKIQRYVDRFVRPATDATSGTAFTLSVSVARDAFTYCYFPLNPTVNTTNSPNLSVYRRHIRLTKIS